jgi:hypothetical protein
LRAEREGSARLSIMADCIHKVPNNKTASAKSVGKRPNRIELEAIDSQKEFRTNWVYIICETIGK